MEAIETIKPQSSHRPEGMKNLLPGSKPTAKGYQTLNTALEEDKPIKHDDREKVERIAEAIDRYMKTTQTDLSIRVHKATGNIMVKVISQNDGKVIREIPPERLLNLAAKMEQMMGVLYDGNV